MLVSDNGPRTSSLIPLYLLYADALCVVEKYKKCLIRVSDQLRLLDLALAGDVRLDALRPLHLGDALAALAPVRLVPAMANRMQLEFGVNQNIRVCKVYHVRVGDVSLCQRVSSEFSIFSFFPSAKYA